MASRRPGSQPSVLTERRHMVNLYDYGGKAGAVLIADGSSTRGRGRTRLPGRVLRWT